MTDTAQKTITDIRDRLGEDLAILGHHYQSDQVIRHTDHRGDSLELARKIPGLTARHIVFCGVHFMAESAAILASSDQQVHMPHTGAGCTMANMAPDRVLEAVMKLLTRNGRKVVPLAYVNTSAAVKDVCGRFGGSVCTSANAKTMLAWALDQGEAVLFLPDRNLASNTADLLDILPGQRHRLDIRGQGANMDLDAAAKARLLIWPGLCSVHQLMKPHHVAAARKAAPGALVTVHPECPPETVQAADAAGSTSQIIDYVARAPKDATIFIGTEINLVNRLAIKYQGQKDIRPLLASPCRNMAKTTEDNLAALLGDLDSAPRITVPENQAQNARTALNRMLDACAPK